MALDRNSTAAPTGVAAKRLGEVTVDGLVLANSTVRATFDVDIPFDSGVAGGGTAITLQTRYFDPANYAYWRLRCDKAGLISELGVVDRGSDRLLKRDTLEFTGGTNEASLTARGKLLTARLNGKVVAVADSPVDASEGFCRVVTEPDFGRLLWIAAEPAPPLPMVTKVHKTFASEKSMSGWSNPARDWTPESMFGGTVFWHRSDLWSDFSVNIDLARLDKRVGPEDGANVGIAVGNDTEDPDGLLRFVLSRADGVASMRLMRGETEVKSVSMKRVPDRFSLHRTGRFITISADDEALWTGADMPGMARIGIAGVPKPKSSSKSSKKSSPDKPKYDGARWHDAVELRAGDVKTFDFSVAPVDWQVASGTWEITNRWQCDPRWSFMAGYNLQGTSCLWYKREHGANLTLEFFMAPKMDRSRGSSYQYAADFNAVIAADGTDINSGYSCMLGGWDNNGSFVTRRDVKVIEHSSTKIPRESKIHHRWFHVKLRKTGGLIEYWVDDELVGSFVDPEPLKGGYLGLWTWRNAIMVSHVRISTDGKLPAAKPFVGGDREPKVPYKDEDFAKTEADGSE
jgi:hypothetical protein